MRNRVEPEVRVVQVQMSEDAANADGTVLRSWREHLLLRKVTWLRVAVALLLLALVAAVATAVVFAVRASDSGDGDAAPLPHVPDGCDVDDFEVTVLTVTSSTGATGASCTVPPNVSLPEGYQLEVVACELLKPRSISLGKEPGTYFLGSRLFGGLSNVMAVVVTPNAGSGSSSGSNSSITVYELDTLDQPHGVQYSPAAGGTLFVTSAFDLHVYEGVDAVVAGETTQLPRLTITSAFPPLPSLQWHHIEAAPADGALFVSSSAGCDHCLPVEGGAAIARVNVSNCYQVEPLYEGIRFSVGFDFHPKDQALWFTNNGADSIQGDEPHDTLNRVSMAGEHFGFPFCYFSANSSFEQSTNEQVYQDSLAYAGDTSNSAEASYSADPVDCATLSTNTYSLGQHVAPLGMRFCDHETNANFPTADCLDHVYIAERASYEVGRAHVESGTNKVVGYEPFLTGMSKEASDAFGGFVDVAFDADGTLLVTDDYAGALYRVSHAA
mmetsp:Transcript_5479/g.19995  ORF Transcript_5479/g.19995 Transcript_5479/m.19995 type:complete len:497 (+) Transcript_5479:167-1657(+)